MEKFMMMVPIEADTQAEAEQEAADRLGFNDSYGPEFEYEVMPDPEEALYRHAAGLLDYAEDADPEKSEYVRGMVELIMSATGKNSDDVEDIARTLASYVR